MRILSMPSCLAAYRNRRRVVLAASLATVFATSACGTHNFLRDDYFGKSVLQPQKVRTTEIVRTPEGTPERRDIGDEMSDPWAGPQRDTQGTQGTPATYPQGGPVPRDVYGNPILN